MKGMTQFFILGIVCVLMFLASPVSSTFAQVDVYDFETVEQEQRFRQLSNEFRCPMCQNANLSSSPGGVAADLRREIYRMIIEGQTDTQIEEFMLSRYGDFVLYRPRLTAQTLLLWFGPFLFLLAGAWIGWNVIRNSANKKPSTGQASGSGAVANNTHAVADVVISAEERNRLNRLLAENDLHTNANDHTGR